MPNTYTVTTPEQVQIDYDIAGIGSRAVALLIDVAIIAVGDAVLGIGGLAVANRLSLLLRATGVQNLNAYVIGLYVLAIFGWTTLYFVLFEGLGNGRTPGKRWMRLRVVSARGERVSMFASIVRNLVRFVDFLPSGYLIGMICMLLTKRDQRLGDLAAGTIVVMERRTLDPAGKRRKARKARESRKARKLREAADAITAGAAAGALGAAGASTVGSATADSAADPPSPEALRIIQLCDADARRLIASYTLRQEHFTDDRRRQLAQQIRDKIAEGLTGDAAREFALQTEPAALLAQLHRAIETLDNASNNRP